MIIKIRNSRAESGKVINVYHPKTPQIQLLSLQDWLRIASVNQIPVIPIIIGLKPKKTIPKTIIGSLTLNCFLVLKSIGIK